MVVCALKTLSERPYIPYPLIYLSVNSLVSDHPYSDEKVVAYGKNQQNKPKPKSSN